MATRKATASKNGGSKKKAAPRNRRPKPVDYDALWEQIGEVQETLEALQKDLPRALVPDSTLVVQRERATALVDAVVEGVVALGVEIDDAYYAFAEDEADDEPAPRKRGKAKADPEPDEDDEDADAVEDAFEDDEDIEVDDEDADDDDDEDEEPEPPKRRRSRSSAASKNGTSAKGKGKGKSARGNAKARGSKRGKVALPA